jgi:V8-like Glu-specific endopeptidase
VGEEVAVVGNPGRPGVLVSFGEVVAVDVVADGRPALTYSAPTGWGSSGSAVLTARGEVVGVHRAWGWGPGFEGNFIGVPVMEVSAAIQGQRR